MLLTARWPEISQESLQSEDGIIATTRDQVSIIVGDDEIQAQFATMKQKLQGKWRFPDTLFAKIDESAKSLSGMSITLVDDIPEVIGAKFPPLLVNTKGKARFIFVDENTEIDPVIDELMRANPDVILMDQDLTTIKRNLPPQRWYSEVWSKKYGVDIIQALRKRWYTGIIIGTSSDADNHRKMITAGANHCIDKTEPDFCLNIANYLNSKK